MIHTTSYGSILQGVGVLRNSRKVRRHAVSERSLRPIASPLWFGSPVNLRFDVFEVENSNAFTSFSEYTKLIPKHILIRPNDRLGWRDFEARGISGALIGLVLSDIGLLHQLSFGEVMRKESIGYRIIFDSSSQGERAEINVYLGHRSCFGPNGLVREVTESVLRRDLEIVEAVQKTLAATLIVRNALSPREGE